MSVFSKRGGMLCMNNTVYQTISARLYEGAETEPEAEHEVHSRDLDAIEGYPIGINFGWFSCISS